MDAEVNPNIRYLCVTSIFGFNQTHKEKFLLEISLQSGCHCVLHLLRRQFRDEIIRGFKAHVAINVTNVECHNVHSFIKLNCLGPALVRST